MSSLRGLMERLRPLVGEKCWDYCVFWGLSEDQRCIEFLSCCCGGADGDHQRLGEQFFPVCPVLPCRDITYQHTRTKACEALEKLPSSMPLDSGNHSQTLFSSQPRWIFIPTVSDSEVQETLTTMVLIPVAGGLVELYVNKHVTEDGKIVEFVMAQCNISSSTDHEDAIQFHGQTSNAIRPSMNEEIFLPTDYSLKSNGHFQQWVPPPSMDNQPLPPWEQPLQNQPSPSSQFDLLNHDFTEANPAHVQHSLRGSDQSLAESVVLSAGLGCDQEGIKHGGCEDGSGSIYSDQIIDEDDEDECGKGSGRSGRGQKGAKNLLAERRRRKKLNDRLYQLRSLVPIISKMDRASILIDAITYIKKLEEQSKSLRDELEDTPDQEDGNNNNGNGENNGNNEKRTTADRGTHCGTIAGKELEAPKQNAASPCLDDKENHMEPLVEVIPVGKEFFLKVLCEDKPRGFVRLMEAIHALGLEVTNVNVTTYSSLALNVFRVQKRESEVVQAEQVKESLLEVTRGHAGTWLDNIERADHENGSSIDRHGSQQQHQMRHHLCDQTL